MFARDPVLKSPSQPRQRNGGAEYAGALLIGITPRFVAKSE